MSTQYDQIAEKYKNSRVTLTERYINEPTFLEILGDVTGKRVLDLACGQGHYTRLIKHRGASHVVGIDISQQQIDVARETENANQDQIDYILGDLSIPFIFDIQYDITTAIFLLHYAETKSQLAAMCQNIGNSLNPGGRFVGINGFTPRMKDKKYPNPDPKYGVTIRPAFPRKEGAMRTVTLTNQFGKVSFDQYYWYKETYERALTDAGLTEITWHPTKVNRLGEKKLGKEFWKDYYKSPATIGITAVKI